MGVASNNSVNSGEAPTERWAILSQDYMVSSCGYIVSTKGKTTRVLKAAGCGYKRGYLFVVLRVNGKSIATYVHRAVAEAFVPNPENKPQVNHIDGNTQNNRADNLEWVTPKENMRHAAANGLTLVGEACPWAKLSEETVIKVCKLLQAGRSVKDIREVTGLTSQGLSKIKARVNWKHISKNYQW